MGLDSQFEDILNRKIGLHAAWVPVTNSFKLGDYGEISDGVFKKLGNITDDFQISFTVGIGKDAAFSFMSENTIVIDVNTGAAITLNPSGEIKANVTYKFQNDKSFLVKAPVINASIIDNVNQVAIKLKSTNGWKRSFIVVYQLYVAQNPLIIGTNEGGTDVTISADGSGLKQFNVGTASASFSLETTKALGVEISGETGVIALGLFKLRAIGGGTKFLGQGEEEVEEETDEEPFEDLNDQKLSDIN